MRAKRALNAHALRAYQGCKTRMSARGLRHGNSKRSNGGAHNATKTIGLQHALLQYFVDCFGRLMCRADSCMLMEKARELRATLLNDKSGLWNDKNLPKLIGNAGAKWFQRWRCRYGITKKVSGMRLKVSWRKIKKRVCVLLTNIFRLRAWWDMCHPNTPMRWLSLDQKPSWWNNAGLCKSWGRKGRRAPSYKENFARTRSRYSILTAVLYGWQMIDHPDNVPKVAMLFKGKPNGRIFKRLKK